MTGISLAGAAPAQARSGLVLVHGRGASARDILGLGAALALPDVAFAAPDAPGQTWWPTSFLAPSEMMEPHVAIGMEAIENSIVALVQAGLDRSQIALGGFSQGACLALEFAARRGGVSAVFGLSGGLVGTGDAPGSIGNDLFGYGDKAFDYATNLGGIPVVMEVHSHDPHIPLARVERSACVLRSLGAEVAVHVIPGSGHGLGPDGMAAMKAQLSAG